MHFTEILQKCAKIVTPLQPHQVEAVKRALRSNLILAHATGSGKTLTSIAAADAIGKPTTVLTPASLVENFIKELRKHKKGGPPVDVISLPTAVLRDYKIPSGNTVIIDEAHSLRNAGTARQEYIKRQLPNAGRIIALTGTPAYNKPVDWAPLVNIVSQEHVIPETESSFRQKFIHEKKIRPSWWERVRYGIKPGVVEELRNADQLRKAVAPYVDIFENDIEKPKRIDQTVKVPMDEAQEATYRYITKSIPQNIRWKVYHNMPPSRAEAAMMNAFLTDSRQVSNTPENYQQDAETGAKIKEAVKRLKAMYAKDPNFKALVYSNFLGNGINSYAALLDKANIPHSVFNGSLTRKQKKEIVDKYNNGEVPVILGSGAASEGLDLMGTKLIQILEPHFNTAKTEQVIGRGIRYKSHSHLPEDERKVLVQHFISTLNPESEWYNWRASKNTAVDEYLTSRAEEKQRIIDQIRKAISKDKK